MTKRCLELLNMLPSLAGSDMQNGARVDTVFVCDLVHVTHAPDTVLLANLRYYPLTVGTKGGTS